VHNWLKKKIKGSSWEQDGKMTNGNYIGRAYWYKRGSGINESLIQKKHLYNIHLLVRILSVIV